MPAFWKARRTRSTSSGLSSTSRIVLPFLIMGLLRRGKFDPKPAALAWPRLHARATTHPLHTLAHDGQPDARPRVRLGAVQALEDTEDALVMLRGNTYAVVLDPEAQVAPAICPSPCIAATRLALAQLGADP